MARLWHECDWQFGLVGLQSSLPCTLWTSDASMIAVPCDYLPTSVVEGWLQFVNVDAASVANQLHTFVGRPKVISSQVGSQENGKNTIYKRPI